MSTVMLKSGAIIRGDKDEYRYSLWRVWDDTLPIMVFVMFNPSKADHTFNDPTIRRCISFAKREGFGGIRVVNLFAFRSSVPSALVHEKDPVGPRNDYFIRTACSGADNSGGRVVAAWGALTYSGRKTFENARIDAVLSMLAHANIPVWCLGTTGNGQPCHPVRLAGDTPLVLYHAAQAPHG